MLRIFVGAIFLLFIAMCLFSAAVTAGEPMDNQVVGVGVNSNGHVFVNFKDLLIEPGCDGRQLVLAKNSIIKEQVLALGLAAHAMKATVVIKPKGCQGSSPSLMENAQDWGWFYIK